MGVNGHARPYRYAKGREPVAARKRDAVVGPYRPGQAALADAGDEARLWILAGQIARQAPAMALDTVGRCGTACETVRN